MSVEQQAVDLLQQRIRDLEREVEECYRLMRAAWQATKLIDLHHAIDALQKKVPL